MKTVIQFCHWAQSLDEKRINCNLFTGFSSTWNSANFQCLDYFKMCSVEMYTEQFRKRCFGNKDSSSHFARANFVEFFLFVLELFEFALFLITI